MGEVISAQALFDYMKEKISNAGVGYVDERTRTFVKMLQNFGEEKLAEELIDYYNKLW